MNERVLVVDDDPQMLRAVSNALKARGYSVATAPNGETALGLLAEDEPDLLLLDLGLPGIEGHDVIERLRTWSEVPVIVISVREDERDKVEALDAGADDYVTKPFGMNELLARMRAALRRVQSADDEEAVITTEHFTIDLAARRVRRGITDAALTATEWALVDVLVRNRGKLVSQRQLLQQVWGPSYDTETNYLRVHFANIRRKLEPEPSRPRYFITEPGMGYRFEG